MYFVAVKFTFAATHYWPDGPKPFDLLHRHEFVFKVKVVESEPRSIEFIKFRQECLRIMNKYFSIYDGFGSRSCEELAFILKHDLEKLGYDVLAVEVWEDDQVAGAGVC